MNRKLHNLAAQIRREPKRAVFLGVLSLALLALWVRHRAASPTPAAAEQEASVGGQAAAWRSAPDLARSAELLRRWEQKPLGHISRNLFASELTIPPPNPGSAPKALTRDEDGLFWRQLERSLASRADREQYRAALGETALKDASSLAVTSIVIGPDSSALVGEKLVHVGEVVPVGGDRGPFTVVLIEAGRVVLARDGHRVALKLGKPGAELIEVE